MKRLLPAFLIASAILFVSTAHAQGYAEAHISIPLPPLPRIHIHAAPVVVDSYQQEYVPAQPYYDGYNNEQVIITGSGPWYGGGRHDRRYERFHENRYYGYHDRGYRRDNYREYGHERGHRDNDRRHW